MALLCGALVSVPRDPSSAASASRSEGADHGARTRPHFYNYSDQLGRSSGTEPAENPEGRVPYGPYLNYSFPGTGYTQVSHTMTVNAAPANGHTFWAHQFLFTDACCYGDDNTLLGGGYFGLQVGSYPNDTKAALFSIFWANGADGDNCEDFHHEGSGWSCRIDPYDFVVDRPYEFVLTRQEQDAEGRWWRATVRDTVTGTTNLIGRLRVPLTWGGYDGSWSTSWTEYFGTPYPSCDAVLETKVRLERPTAEGGTVAVSDDWPSYGINAAAPRGCGAGPNGGTVISSDATGDTEHVRPLTSPANDDFSAAHRLTGTFGVASGSNIAASIESDEPVQGGLFLGGSSVWWKWTAAASGRLSVDLAGSDIAPVVSVYAGSALNDLVPIGSDTDGSGDAHIDEVPVTAGATYWIAVDGAGWSYPDSGAIQLAWSLVTVPTGLLRVVTSPPVPSQISVDGHLADTWGLTWLKEPAGAHTVCFGAVPGYSTPGCQTVQITDGATSSVTGTFTARGYLHVTTSPAVNARVRVDGLPRNNWGMWTSLPVGLHEVCFDAVAGYTPPACQVVLLTAGATATITGTYTPSSGSALADVGYLRVTTSPALPSQISVDGHVADTWGLNWLQLAPGDHSVCFTHVEGYSEPSCGSVSVTASATSTVAATFARRGFLKVETRPAVPATISVNGFPANDWGTFTDRPVGTYLVCFGAVSTLTTPDCQSATVSAGSTATIVGNYP